MLPPEQLARLRAGELSQSSVEQLTLRRIVGQLPRSLHRGRRLVSPAKPPQQLAARGVEEVV